MNAAVVEREPITISLVAQHVFCPRRAWLEAAGERTDTYQVAVGLLEHAPTDDPAAGRPARVLGLDVADAALGVTGRCDTVEVGPGGALTVVEYKATPVRRRPDVTAPMRTQLALQVACLRAMGHTIIGQAVYFTGHRLRVPVALDDGDFQAIRRAVEETRRTVDGRAAPPPLQDDPRCGGCSHVEVCLPEQRASRSVRRRIACHDGLTPSGVNRNQGAESSLMWLIALERIRQLRRTSDARTCDAVPVDVPL